MDRYQNKIYITSKLNYEFNSFESRIVKSAQAKLHAKYTALKKLDVKMS